MMSRNLMRAIQAAGDIPVTSPNHPDLVASYTDNVSGATAFDDSPNAYDGTIVLATFANGAFEFDRVAVDYVDIGRIPFEYISNTRTFGISFWFLLNSVEDFHTMIGNSPNASLDRGFGVFTAGTELQFSIVRSVNGQPTINTISSGANIGTGVFIHIVVNGDNAVGVEFFKDNASIHTAAYDDVASTGANTRSVHFGRTNFTSNTVTLDGKMGRIRLFNRPFTPAEVGVLNSEGAPT